MQDPRALFLLITHIVYSEEKKSPANSRNLARLHQGTILTEKISIWVRFLILLYFFC